MRKKRHIAVAFLLVAMTAFSSCTGMLEKRTVPPQEESAEESRENKESQERESKPKDADTGEGIEEDAADSKAYKPSIFGPSERFLDDLDYYIGKVDIPLLASLPMEESLDTDFGLGIFVTRRFIISDDMFLEFSETVDRDVFGVTAVLDTSNIEVDDIYLYQKYLFSVVVLLDETNFIEICDDLDIVEIDDAVSKAESEFVDYSYIRYENQWMFTAVRKNTKTLYDIMPNREEETEAEGNYSTQLHVAKKELFLDQLDRVCLEYDLTPPSALPSSEKRRVFQNGYYLERTFDLGNGAALEFSELIDDDGIFWIVCHGGVNELTYPQLLNLQKYMACTIIALDGEENLEGILAQLHLTRTDATWTKAEGEVVTYRFLAQDGGIVFYVSRE